MQKTKRMDNKNNSLNWSSDIVQEWLKEARWNNSIVSIGTDFILGDGVTFLSALKRPFKANVNTIFVCTKGQMKWSIDMQPHVITAPSRCIVFADQILQNEYISDDLDGFFIIVSKQFLGSILSNTQDRTSHYLYIKKSPCIHLNNEMLETIRVYYDALYRVITREDNPSRLEVVRYLILAFFHLNRASMPKQKDSLQKQRKEELTESFLELVQKHFKQERSVWFYAEKLHITPKYLSTVVRQISGRTAGEWIDEYVVLEAKALLKSTNMTIQQISDELNFSSQSFFGKYFKRVVEISPKEYRNM